MEDMTLEPFDSSGASRAKATSPWPLLDRVSSPADLKELSSDELPRLCTEVREFLLDTVQNTGGHLGSNLGVVEMTVAMHKVFDFRRDRLVWDVSHQCYPHKVLTGRRDGFSSLRQTEGLCGFTHPEESPYDLFHTGHAGTSISLGLGMSIAGVHEPDPPHVVSVIGDASLGAGVAFEALNHAGAKGERLIVVLNDNEWSISKSVGSLARYLTRIRSNRLVQRAGQETKNLIHAIPLIGPRVDRALDDLGEVMRHAVVPGHVFEELGVRYIGPVDGHDVNGLVETFERISRLDGVVLLHLLTDKGKGHPKAPDHPERVHAVKGGAVPAPRSDRLVQPSPPELRKDDLYKTETPDADAPAAKAFTKSFATHLEALAEKDLRVHAITAAMPSGTGLTGFAERFPTRFHDTGITEQHAVALSAGMAKSGLRPVTAIYSTFLQRGYDQVFQEVALQGLPVVLCLDRAGPVGGDGPTHNGVFDIAYLRTLPGFTLGAPRDDTDMGRMLELALGTSSPTALRFPRGNCPKQECLPAAERSEMLPGRAEQLAEGEGLVIWAYGAMVEVALEVAVRLRTEDIEIGVVDARFVKPLDEELLARHLREYRHIVTLEDHQRSGGFGAAVLEAAHRLPVGDERLARIRVMGIPDRFLEHMSSREEQLASAGLDHASVERVVRSLLQATLV